MLLDVLGPVTLMTSFLNQSLNAMLPAISIPVWDQYVDLMEWALNSLANIFQNGGLAIIAFTIIIKTILLPLTVKSIRSSKNMQELAPRIKEIQKKYGADRQKASQETFALYQQHGVNPMSGCLPMLIQIPIFFGLYRSIVNLNDSQVGHWTDGFLWMDSLNVADPWKVLPILAGLFQFVQSRMMRPANQKITDPQQQIMNMMMNFMPLMVVLFGWNFAAGPVLYWATQSIYSVIQQWFITGWGSLGEWFPWLPELPDHRRLGYRAPRPISDVMVVSGEPIEQKGFSGWMNKRMQEAQKNAETRQEALKQQKAGKNGAGGKAGNDGGSVGVSSDEVIDVEATASSRPTRKGTSYQDRVNAATKFGAKPDPSLATATNGSVQPGADPNRNSKASKKARRKGATS
ncbi:MAG: YidC/Oxa1 family membrane protein insertase [Chloroflexota bacterium]|nr:YidC/Oxa1 family membrane protein insertase [Chloroflexota bacterium]